MKWICDLEPPRVPREDARHSYLPQAAMGLGDVRAVGTNPTPAVVARLVVQEQTGGWCLFRLDAGGGFIGDTWHPDREDAIRVAADEFGVSADDFRQTP
jgi:hypothetical protein